MQTPSFFYDGTEKDREFSIVYWISWTVRCAVEPHNTNLGGYPKKVLLKLLGLENANNVTIKYVETWKEDHNIDLWIELEMSNGEQHAIIIECKMDTTYSSGQLATYREVAENYYKTNDDKKNFKRKYVYLVGRDDDFWEGEEQECEKHGFIPLTVCELKQAFGDNPQPTGNALFDEFWFEYYPCGMHE